MCCPRRISGGRSPSTPARSAGAHPYLVTPSYTWEARQRIGPGPLLAVEQKVVLETDSVRAREIARATITPHLSLPNYTNSLLRQGFSEDDLRNGGSNRLIDEVVAWGSVEDVLQRITAHLAAGADHVAIQVLDSPAYEPANPPPTMAWRSIAEGLTRSLPV
jgi:probable F420-dependent oxidoreductase